jgi:hypothetical protein
MKPQRLSELAKMTTCAPHCSRPAPERQEEGRSLARSLERVRRRATSLFALEQVAARAGRSAHWLQIKNLTAPAVRRLENEDWT